MRALFLDIDGVIESGQKRLIIPTRKSGNFAGNTPTHSVILTTPNGSGANSPVRFGHLLP